MEDTALDLTILKFIKKEKRFMLDLISKVTEDYFTPDYRLAYQVLTSYFKRFKSVPSLEVLREYSSAEANPQLDESLKHAYMEDEELNDGDYPFMIEKLQNRYNDQVIRLATKQIIKAYEDGTANISALNKHIAQTATQIATIHKANIFSQGSVGESVQARWDNYKAIEENPEIGKGILTGFIELDKHTNGLGEADLMIVSGQSSTGKSLIMGAAAINAWLGSNTIDTPPEEFKDDGANVLFISIEMPKEKLELRLDSNLSGINIYHLRDGACTTEEKEHYLKALKFQKQYDKKKKFYIMDMARDCTVAAIEAQYQSLLSMFEPDLIVIDYLGVMQPQEATGIDWQDQGKIAAELHEFARVYKKPIITAAQAKGMQLVQNGLKQVFDVERLARSKMIGDNASIVVQIEKTADFKQSSYVRVHITKNRDGESGGYFDLVKEYWRMRVTNPDNNLTSAITVI